MKEAESYSVGVRKMCANREKEKKKRKRKANHMLAMDTKVREKSIKIIFKTQQTI